MALETRDQDAAIAPPHALPATAYGAHLQLVLTAARAAGMGLLSSVELHLMEAFAALPAALQDQVARLAERRTGQVVVADAEHALRAGAAMAIAAGWLVATDHVHGPALQIAPAARTLVRTASAIACAEDGVDGARWVRIALGRHPLPAASPAARALASWCAGARTLSAPADPPPWPDRRALEGLLAAPLPSEEAPDPVAWEHAIAVVEGMAGEPTPLIGAHLQARTRWAALVLDGLERLDLPPALARRAWRALRRTGVGPRVMRHVWEAAWAGAGARARRLIATHLAPCALWTPAERSHWTQRGRPPGERRRRDMLPWRRLGAQAWLARDGQGPVLAQGQRVEAHAARRLAAEGWRVLHAEGGFWQNLALHLLAPVVGAPAPGAWPGPLQLAPLDLGRWGFAARRPAALSGMLAALARDPAEVLAQAQSRVAAAPWDRWAALPDTEAATAVVAGMPRAALVALLRMVLTNPRAAAGLPDLIAWRGRELAFWEVKSPRDQLSEAQRYWLSWLVAEGVQAGELRLAAREPTQARLPEIAPAPVRPPSTAPAVVAPRQRPVREPARVSTVIAALAGGWDRLADPGTAAPWACALVRGGVLPVTSPVGDGSAAGLTTILLGATPTLPMDPGDGRPRASRPITAIIGVRAQALLVCVLEGRRVRQRSWRPVPAGLVVPVALVPEALVEGGIGLRGAVLLRRAGWLLPADHHREVAVMEAEALRLDASSVGMAAPDGPPPWQAAPSATLQPQLALLGARAHLVVQDGSGMPWIAATAPEGVLWVLPAEVASLASLPAAWACMDHG